MKEISISIVIPVYNVEPYIERCFQSVISQTYRNYEIIFVDDCGTDKSVKILQRLIDEYNGDISLRLIHHEINKGLSAARNSGMKIASGDYIYFVDSDDLIFPESLEKLVQPLMNQPWDLVCGRSLVLKNNCVSLSQKVLSEINHSVFEYVYSGMDSPMGISSTACNHLYRLDFLKQNKILFREGLFFEDILFNVELFCHLRNAIFSILPYKSSIKPNERSCINIRQSSWHQALNIQQLVFKRDS